MLGGQASLFPVLILTIAVIVTLYYVLKEARPPAPRYCKHCGRTDKKWRLRTTGGGNTAATQGPRHTVWVHVCKELNK